MATPANQSAYGATATQYPSGPFVAIRILDLGSGTGNLAQKYLPATVGGALADKLRAALAEQGVSADVQVVSSTPGVVSNGLIPGIAVGAGVVGLAALIIHILKGR